MLEGLPNGSFSLGKKSMIPSDLRYDLRDMVERELNKNERVLWVGQPIPAKMARKSLPAVLFGIPWTGFALFWMAGASGFRVPDFDEPFDFFPLFGLPFVLVGILMLTAPIWAKRAALKTVYVLTDERAIIFESKLSATKVRSLSPDQLSDIYRTEDSDGNGDIVFMRETSVGSRGRKRSRSVGFIVIREVREVESKIRELRDVVARRSDA